MRQDEEAERIRAAQTYKRFEISGHHQRENLLRSQWRSARSLRDPQRSKADRQSIARSVHLQRGRQLEQRSQAQLVNGENKISEQLERIQEHLLRRLLVWLREAN